MLVEKADKKIKLTLYAPCRCNITIEVKKPEIADKCMKIRFEDNSIPTSMGLAQFLVDHDIRYSANREVLTIYLREGITYSEVDSMSMGKN